MMTLRHGENSYHLTSPTPEITGDLDIKIKGKVKVLIRPYWHPKTRADYSGLTQHKGGTKWRGFSLAMHN